MSKKDEASPRQRQIMEARWAKAREECPAGTCVPSSRFHVAGCTRRTNRMVTLAPEQKVKVTNLNTGVTSEATTVKEALDTNNKQAILLEPRKAEPEDFPQEYWNQFERGYPAARYSYGGVAEQQDVPETETSIPPILGSQETAPARPWWKFWGRRG